MDEDKKNGLLLDDEVSPLLNPQKDHDRKITRYTKAKNRSQALSEYILKHRPEIRNWGLKVKNCTSYLIFNFYYTKNVYRLQGNNRFCRKHLFCALCAIRRAAKQLQAYLEKTKVVLFDNPDCELAFLTLTVKNGDDLPERFHHLQGNYRKMVQKRRDFLKGRNDQSVFNFLLGGVSTYEFTNIGNGWHPHLHMIALVEKGFDYKAKTRDLKKEWEKITTDSHQCDIRPIDAKDEKSLLKAFIEVFKYTVKNNDMSLEDQAEAGIKLAGKRLIATFGKFYGVKVSDDLNDDLEEELKLEPYVQMIYTYSDSFGYQVHSQHEMQEIPETNKEKLHRLQYVYDEPANNRQNDDSENIAK